MNSNGLTLATPESDEDMAGWETTQWTVVVNHQGRQQRVEQPLPYARIGSHPGCEIVLDNPRLPPVAYLLVAFQGSVEAWPVAPIAMPRWGVLSEGEQFPVGTFRISVELDSSETPGDSLGEVYPELGVLAGDHRWSAKLQRRVTIVGDDHPSIKRLRDVGLQCCHGAFVSVQQRLWYLPLSPADAPYLTGRSQVTELHHGEQVQAGRVAFVRLPANSTAAVDSFVDKSKEQLSMVDHSVSRRRRGAKLPGHQLDGVASQTTERLLQLGRRRAKKSRWMFAVAVAVSVLVAAVALPLIWIAATGG
ncbi:hypothetical protein [Roseimaritima ulvae]|uniref:Uncharacterized protein n=1 Tax=Roseimaritima ulvae TaxID=980254 RepID=A0A5B9R7M1_9BACT|nr:hypothetical protein [Roseimaritima ulvae]QEG42463.1 hypothetical protein UC8_45020 [Roseimaritima ulvae]